MKEVEIQAQLLVPVSHVIAIIVTLASVIGVLFWRLQAKDAEQKKTLEDWRLESTTNAVKMTQALADNSNAVNALTKVTDKIFEHLNKL